MLLFKFHNKKVWHILHSFSQDEAYALSMCGLADYHREDIRIADVNNPRYKNKICKLCLKQISV